MTSLLDARQQKCRLEKTPPAFRVLQGWGDRFVTNRKRNLLLHVVVFCGHKALDNPAATNKHQCVKKRQHHAGGVGVCVRDATCMRVG